MRRTATLAAALASGASASSLSDICTAAKVKAALPADGDLLGITMLPDTATASSATSGDYTYCNVTVAYTHGTKGDTVNLKYGFPAPSSFKNRFYVGGGGGYSLNSDATGGLEYGAVSCATDAGYDAFDYSFDEVVLEGNGTINWDATYMFGYQALGELTKVGKYITKKLYDTDTLYTYYEGCSDGGREGMSQIQRYGDEYDGVITGAPAFRMAHQQVNHLFPAVVEQTQGYFPPTCELAKIVNATIEACDELDGRKDGVVSRSDLCMLKFDLSSLEGEPYYCAAETSTSLGFGFGKRAEGSTTSLTPEQNGTVTAAGIKAAKAMYDGLHNSKDERAYVFYQYAASLADGDPTWNNDTSSWEIDVLSTGGSWVTKFIELVDLDNLSSLDNVTYDTLVDWMTTGYIRYLDSLQTTLPDLTTFKSSGGKLLHYHGEADNSVPTASSVHYWQAVKSIMYPDETSAAAEEAMKEWYQLYIVPGAAHCSRNTLQPNGPFPEDNMATIIDWVENGVQPTRLNATVDEGTYTGEVQKLCQFPKRPLWKSNSTFECVTDEKSYESWTYTFDAFKLPIY